MTGTTTTARTPLLELRSVDASYGATRVLREVSFDVADGGMVALLGANGAGKTTTLRAICNTFVRASGEIRFAGERIDGRPTERIAAAGIGHVPDGRGTFLGLTVLENLRLGAYLRKDDSADVDKMCRLFPILKTRIDQQAGTLSGGEQQMLAIARALMGRPRLLLLDEPSFGLAPVIVQEIFRILRQINQEERTSILLVEQNVRLALDLVDHVVLLETGKVVASGLPQVITADEAVRRAYLGA